MMKMEIFLVVVALLLCIQCNAKLADVSLVSSSASSISSRNRGLPYSSVVASSKAQKSPVEAAHHHGISTSSLIINIVADLCPHGMLALAYGLAQEGTTGIVPAVLLLVLFGMMSGYTMTSYADMSVETQSGSISELWGKLINPKTKYIADLAVFSLCFGCCIFYSAFIGDIFAYLSSALGIEGIFSKRWVSLGTISSIVLLPLCLLEDLSALQFSSVLGVCGIMITFLTLVKRAFDGTYAPSKAIIKGLASKFKPSFPTPKMTMFKAGKGTMILANMLCVAYMAHYNAINYYKELKSHTPRKYKIAVVAGFGISFAVFTGMMFLGYSIFGLSAQPLILNNFHKTKDLLATIARFATGVAITFAYPLMFAGLKSSLYNLLDASILKATIAETKEIDKKNLASSRPAYTSLIARNQGHVSTVRKSACAIALAVITSIAFKCGEEDVSLVLGIVGSVIGCGVAYVLPSVMRLIHMRNRKQLGLKNSIHDVIANHALAVIGVVFGVIGIYITIESENKHHH